MCENFNKTNNLHAPVSRGGALGIRYACYIRITYNIRNAYAEQVPERLTSY